MAQLFFKYGAMNSGKSMEILKVAYNYEEQGKKVLIYTSAIDNRDEIGYVSSRSGERKKAVPVYDDTDIYQMTKLYSNDIHCVLIDEVQFLKKHHVQQLAAMVDELAIPVMGFGLKNDFQNELFEGSKYMLLYADKIEEIKTICWFCNKKATMALRVDQDGLPVYTGDQIQVGGNESYYPVCRKCHTNPKPLYNNVLKGV